MVNINGERHLASIETVSELLPMDADVLEAARIKGWTVVVKKGEFQPGDRVLYIEPDAALPLDDPRFAFLADRGAKVIGGKKYHVLKTAKLRGVYSQGIVFPLSEFPTLECRGGADQCSHMAYDVKGDFVDTLLCPNVVDSTGYPYKSLDAFLGIFKYEPPAPQHAGTSGSPACGWFPSYLVKTDAERVQNLTDETWAAIQAEPAGSWIPTEKVDGTSLTAWVDCGEDSTSKLAEQLADVVRDVSPTGMADSLISVGDDDVAIGVALGHFLDKTLVISPDILERAIAYVLENEPELWTDNDIAQIRSNAIPPVRQLTRDYYEECAASPKFRVASRNLELDTSQPNAYVLLAQKYLEPHLNPGEWVQAELAGPGIQANPLKLPAQRLFVFGFGTHNSVDKSGFRSLPLPQWPNWATQLAPPHYDFTLPATITETISQVEKIKSLANPNVGAEGIVWTHKDGKTFPALGDRPVFKSISAAYLLKHGG